MQQWLCQYRHMNTILFADSKEDARKQATTALEVLPDHAQFIAVVPRTADGRIG